MTTTPRPWRRDGSGLCRNQNTVFIVGGKAGVHPTIFVESICSNEKEVKQFEQNVNLIIKAVNAYKKEGKNGKSKRSVQSTRTNLKRVARKVSKSVRTKTRR